LEAVAARLDTHVVSRLGGLIGLVEIGAGGLVVIDRRNS
jgi:hypothetical protein